MCLSNFLPDLLKIQDLRSLNQNFYLALNPFMDFGQVLQEREIDKSGIPASVNQSNYFKNSKDPAYPICDPFKRPMNIYSQKGCMWRSQEDGGCVFCSVPYYNLRLREPKLVLS